MLVYVVTDGEGGWDNVRGVFKNKRDAYKRTLGEDFDDSELSIDELDKLSQDTRFIVHDTQLKE